MVTQERLKSLLCYDPPTGQFTWIVSKANVRAGSTAGSRGNHGYWEIRIDRKLYLAHRLAWLYVHGRWPDKQIDHINCERLDNRFCNLREASLTENNRNRPLRKDNTSGFKGVHWASNIKKWSAHIAIDGKRIYIGSFDKPEDAHNAYCSVAQRAFGSYFNDGRTQ